MKQIYLVTRLQVLLFGLLIISSCSKFDFDKIKTDNLNTEWGVPLVQSKLTLADFLNDTSGAIHVNENGLISLIYESKELVSIEAKERTKIPKLTDETTEWFNIVQPDTLKSDWLVLSQVPVEITFELDSQCQRIDSLYLTSGLYDLILKTNLDLDSGKVDLNIPNFIDTIGNPLICSFDINNIGGEIITAYKSIYLDDYFVQFDNIPVNTIIIYADVLIKSDAIFNFDPSKEYFISLTNELTDIKYSRFYGYIGIHEESYSDTIDLNIFNSVDCGSINFGPECVKLNIDLYNELGLPIKIEAEEFTAYHTTGNSAESMDIYFIANNNEPNTIIMNTPDCNSGVGEFTNIGITSTNILDAISISPNKIYFKLIGKLNYDGNISTNCFRDTSEFKIDVKLELDLFGSISTFKIADTIDFSIESVENLNTIDFRIVITNGFPINAAAQVEFLDADNKLLYTLFPNEEEIIVSASIGEEPDFRVIQPSRKETIITINGDAMESVLNASQVVFKSTLSTPDSLVKIYSDYSIDLTLSAKLYVNY